MKKILAIALVAMMTVALCVCASANIQDGIQPNQSEWKYVTHTSYDEIRPGIMCGGKTENIDTPTVAAGTTELTFWGWIGATEEIKGFSYTLDGGEKVTKAEFTVAAEDAVIQAAAPTKSNDGNETPNATASRFQVVVPVTDGSHAVKVYADFANGSDLIWDAKLTVGEATEAPAEQPAAEKDPDTWLCKAGGSVNTGWWMHPFTEKDWEINAKFTTPNAFDGFIFTFYANDGDGATVVINLLDESGAVLETQNFTAIGNGNTTIKFNETHNAGTYTIQFKNTDQGAHFVLGSSEANEDLPVEMSGNGNTNTDTLVAPIIALTGAVPTGSGETPSQPSQPSQPTNPTTADASVIAIAAIGCLALAGIVVAKKVR